VAIEELSGVPDVGRLMRRAIAGAVRGRIGGGTRGDRLPETELIVRDVGLDREHLARYARVCGFRLSDMLPATYPHLLAFPLSLELMTRPDFPFPLIGLVHIQNTIEQVRPVTADERLDIAVRAADLREHERGRAIDVVATATVDGAVVWRGRSSYLRRSGQSRERRDARARMEPPPAAAVWRVPVQVGAAYAEVSGDRNPIHTSTIAARAFGFPRRIAHGMWSKARCLAALEGRLPESFTVDVAFKLPVLLPATVAFSTTRHAHGGWRFGLHDAKSGRPHLSGDQI